MYYDINKIDKDKKFEIKFGSRHSGQLYNLQRQYLFELGFNINSDGFYYWITAINLYKKKQNTTMTKIYEEIGKYNNKTVSQVERAMRTASATAKYKIKKMYNYDGKLSNQTILNLFIKIPIVYDNKVEKLKPTIEYDEIMNHIPNIE